MASAALKSAYRQDGFVVVPDVLSAAEIAILHAETGAVAGAMASGDVLAIHFPHKLSQVSQATMRHPAMTDVLTTLIGPDVKAMQSMLFVKPAGKPGQAWHQDEAYLPTRDRSLCGAWIALDDARIENGCLWAHPGSHIPGILYPMHPHGEERFDASEEAYDFPYPREGGVPIELAAGSGVFFSGYLLHRSLPNVSKASTRRALVIHYMSAASLLPWNHDGHSPTEDFRDIELIAGVDPYAWKGTTDLSRPFIRAEKRA